MGRFMNFRPVPLWATLAVCAWIAFDIGRGAMSGIAEARQARLDSASLEDILRETAESYRERNGDEWTKHATIHSVSARGGAVIFDLELTSRARRSIEPRWAKNRVVGMRHDIRKKACRDKELTYVLSRGGRIHFRGVEGGVANLLPTDVPADYC